MFEPTDQDTKTTWPNLKRKLPSKLPYDAHHCAYCGRTDSTQILGYEKSGFRKDMEFSIHCNFCGGLDQFKVKEESLLACLLALNMVGE
jgi:hypothetical protein